ncbi:uncharacterized protein LOC112524244 [Cynara cardunculus var. scolymus]|uniref:uncharacterized protein LOC112524244 n=1 Tax=Cynara cardunculus var. scolymus TaxID=59895 RepID=UPI000D62372E|nr:uncharacterized protein LOC112524244 [Cynara cardunculus var. scolymus]
MARRALIKAVSLEELWRTSVDRTSFSLYLSRQKFQTPISSGRCRCKIITNVRDCCSERRIDPQINCSRDENLSSSSSVVAENSHEPPQEVDLQIVSDTSKTEGRVGQTTNMVFGGTVIDGSTCEWLTLNQKVNTYPSVRRFTAIGIGGDDFVQSMVGAVESVIQHSIPQAHVKQRVSSGGKYVSVNIGPVQVISREQVRAVYNAMRTDERMKFFL